ncbi:MAG: hypothetical protein ACR2J9_03040 [Gaiellales bacterium]
MVARRLLPLLALTAVLAACGGSASAPPTQSVDPPPPPTGANAVTISPFEAETGQTTSADSGTAQAVFPAETPSGVLALAAQHPDGQVVYATIVDGTQGELMLARLGDKALVAVTGDSGTTRVGVNLATSSITWVCVTQGADTPTCKKQDFDRNGAIALATAAQLVGEDTARQIAAKVAAASDGGLQVQTRANQVDASCLTGTEASGGNLMVCVSPSGFITDTEQNGTIARASTVTPDVDPKALTLNGAS